MDSTNTLMNINIANVLLMIIPMVLAITLHEAAHAFVAYRCGDSTAKAQGRLSLNPIVHIDPMGTIVVPGLMFIFSAVAGIPLIFGWAKPVPIVPSRFRNIRQGLRMTALAGPLSNVAMALAWGLLLLLYRWLPDTLQSPFAQMCMYGISFNAVLFALNILPIPPLDGSRVVESFLNAKASEAYRKIEPYGTWIILALLISGALNYVLYPLASLVFNLVAMMIQI